MNYHRPFLTLVLVFGLAVIPARAAEGDELDAVQHTADGVYLDFAPFGKIELPRLFLVRRADGSLMFDAFSSTTAALQSGRYGVLEINGDRSLVVLHDEAILAEMIEGKVHIYRRLVPVAADNRDAGSILIDFSITRHLIFGLLAALLMLLAFIPTARRYGRGVGRETAPQGGFQNAVESLIIFVRDEIAKPNIGVKYARFVPYLLTAFFFILICNLLGLVPFGGAATSNIAITGTLAAFTFIITQFSASRDYWLHIFWPPGMPLLVKLILIPVEILGIFTKPVALAIRLFANMSAGYLVILSLIGMIFTFNSIFGTTGGLIIAPISLGMTLFILVLKLLVAFIQAYVFTVLSALFIGMAVAEHHHPEHGGLDHGPHDDHGHVTPVVDGVDQDLGMVSRSPVPA
jgi:F-type H+-transporting ATPase subunit a